MSDGCRVKRFMRALRFPVSPVRLGAWRSGLGVPFPRFPDSPCLPISAPSANSQFAIRNGVRQSSVVSGRVLLSSDNSQSLSAAAQAGETRNSKLRTALVSPFPRFTLHVLRFTIRSFVPLSPRMSKSTSSTMSPIKQNEQIKVGTSVLRHKFLRCATSSPMAL